MLTQLNEYSPAHRTFRKITSIHFATRYWYGHSDFLLENIIL